MKEWQKVTIEAREVKVGDRLVPTTGPEVVGIETGEGVVLGGGREVGAHPTVEVFTEDDPMGMPAATFGAEEPVEVYREVSR